MNSETKLLLVDDNQANLAILDEIFSEEFRYQSATNGQQALEIANDYKPDVILLDIMMPGIDGYEVCRKIRETPEFEHMKIVMVSAKAMLRERLHAYAMGADDYVTKPFDARELLSKVRVFAKLKRVEEVDKLKNDVFSLLLHELDGPLRRVIASSELLANEQSMDQGQRCRFGQAIHTNVEQLKKFLGKVKSLSDLRSGRTAIERRVVDVAAIVAAVVRRLAPEAAARGIQVLSTGRGAAIASGDDRLIDAAIANVVENAVLHGEDGKSVEIELTAEEGRIWITVADHGKGIRPDLLPRIFQEFVDADSKLYTEGPGLSLALTAEIVRRHGGRVAVTSDPGQRTVFTVELPLADDGPGA